MGIFLQVHCSIEFTTTVMAVATCVCYKVPTSLGLRKELSIRKIVGDSKPTVLAYVR